MTVPAAVGRLPPGIRKVYDLALPYLQEGRPGDIEHVHFMLEVMLDFRPEGVDIDLDIMLPCAILHDIGHAAVLPEHFF